MPFVALSEEALSVSFVLTNESVGREQTGLSAVISSSSDAPLQPTSTPLTTPIGSPSDQTPFESRSTNATNVFLPSRTWPESASESEYSHSDSPATRMLSHVTFM